MQSSKKFRSMAQLGWIGLYPEEYYGEVATCILSWFSKSLDVKGCQFIGTPMVAEAIIQASIPIVRGQLDNTVAQIGQLLGDVGFRGRCWGKFC